MNAQWWGPIPATNFLRGRHGNPTTILVDHWMAGTMAGADARFKTPGEQASAHFGIAQDGRLVQWVQLEDTAYHCGVFTKNLISIGIEHEAGPAVGPSEELYRTSAAVHAWLGRLFDIRLEVGVTVFGHRDISPTQCPGTLDLDRIVREAGMDEYVTKAELDAYKAALQRQLDAVNEGLLATDAKIATALRKAADELDNV